MANTPIDIHVHLFTKEAIDAYGVPYVESQTWFARGSNSALYGRATTPIPLEEMVAEFRDASLDKVVVANLNAYSIVGKALANDLIAEYCSRYDGFLYGLCSVDPYVEGAVKELERSIRSLGLVGLKLHPSYPFFYPNDRSLMYPLYEKCVELNVPVLFHSGTTRLTGTKIESCRPVYLDSVAADFPDLKIIAAHFGWPWVDECLAVAWRNRNVYIDLSGWLPRYIYLTAPQVIQFMNSIIPDKFVFGSDYPGLKPQAWIDDFETLTKEGFEWGGKKQTFKKEVREKVLWMNAEKVFTFK